MVALLLLLRVPVFAAADASWPSHRDGLHLLFQDALHPTMAYRADGTAMPGWQFDALGRARVRHDGALLVGHGGFHAPALGPALGDVFKESVAFSLVISLTAENQNDSGAVFGLGGGNGPQGQWLQISQQGKVWKVTLSTSEGVLALEGGTVTAAQPATIAVTSDGAQVQLYQDGQEIARRALSSPIGFTHPTIPVVGELQTEGAGWQGAVAGIALYNERLGSESVAALHRSWGAVEAARKSVSVLRVRGALVEKSSIFLPSELAPYERGLTVFVYDVVEVLDGVYDKEQVYVAHWTVLGRESLPFADVAVGATLELSLELFDENPQLASENLSDDAVVDFSIPYYYDGGGRALRPLSTETRP